MGRSVLSWVCVFALGVVPLVGCGETAGAGGSGGSAGSGGAGGTGGSGGGADLCADNVCRCTEAGIRAAIAEGGGPFTFDCDGSTTVTTQDTIVIDNDVILDGGGNLRVDGDEDHRVFSVPEGMNAELHGFLVTGGDAIGGDAYEAGGGIHNSGTLTLMNTTVSGNVARAGGGILNEDELFGTPATLTLIDSTVADNIADFVGGISSGGTLTLTGSAVLNNTSATGADIFNAVFGIATITNTTVTGSILNGAEASIALTNCTVVGDIRAGGGPVTVVASLVDGDCMGDITSGGYNIESPGNTCGFDQEGDQPNVSADDLKLGELADNGGSTMTHALLPGSVAIDGIPADMCEVDEDQRGEPRPGTEGSMCDVGAFEVQEGSP